jgi:hypothetical protein
MFGAKARAEREEAERLASIEEERLERAEANRRREEAKQAELRGAAGLLTPVSIDQEIEEAVYQEQERLATALGFTPTPLIILRFNRFMKSEGLPIYPYKNVRQFLDIQYGRAKIVDDSGDHEDGLEYRYRTGDWPTWSWRPMRAQDEFTVADELSGRIPFQVAELSPKTWARTNRGKGNGNVLLNRPYTLPIPIPALQIAEKIQAVCPEAHFYVSDILKQTEKNGAPVPPDPFLAVLFENYNRKIVVAHWDEPNYK